MAAARAMLGLTQIDLSGRAGVALTTVKQMTRPASPSPRA